MAGHQETLCKGLVIGPNNQTLVYFNVEAQISEVICKTYFVGSDEELSPVCIFVGNVRVDVLQQVLEGFY